MTSLFSAIGRTHGVTQQQVRQSLGRRRRSLDFAVILSFAALYGFVASGVVRWIFRRVSVDEKWPALVATLVASVTVSAAGVLLGEIWSGIVEMIRVGNDHLSYRAYRIPWGQHRVGLFVVGVVLVWLIALVRYRVMSREAIALLGDGSSGRHGSPSDTRRTTN